MQHGFLSTGRLCELNWNFSINNSLCHSVGNLAKLFDGVNLTEAKAETV